MKILCSIFSVLRHIGNKYKILYFFTFSLSIFLQINSSFAQLKTDPVLNFARQQIEDESYIAAISTLNSFLSTHKNNADGLYWKGFCYYKMENVAAAKENYKLALKYNPRYYPANVEMANINVSEKKYTEALPFFNMALVVHDSDINLIMSRGMCYYYLDKFEMAIKDYKSVIKLDPKNYKAYNNKGSATYNNQNIVEASKLDLQSAEIDFTKSLEIKPDFQLALRNRGIVRFYLDDLDNAYKDLLYASKLDPKDAKAQYYIGKLLFKQNNYIVALQFFDNSIIITNNNSEVYIDRGICKIDMGNINGARTDFYKSNQYSTDKAYSTYQIARSYAAEGNKKQASTELKEAKKQGLFNDTKYFNLITNDKYFKVWSKDKEFMDLIYELKFGKK